MKHFFKVLLILTLCTLCVWTFAACDDQADPNTTTTTTTTEDNSGGQQTPPATRQVLINANKTTNYKVITQKGMSASTLSLVREFITDVQQKTGARFGQLSETDAPENDYEITINVTHDREDAAALYEKTGYTHYRIERNGNRIMVAAFSDDVLEDALKALYNQITKDTTTGDWGIPASFKANEFGFSKSGGELANMDADSLRAYYSFLPMIEKVPKFNSQSGTLYSVSSIGNDGYAIAVKNATKAEYDAYINKITASGFTLYTSNTMSAGSDVAEQNTYHFFTAENITLCTQYQPNLKVARVYFLPTHALPSTTPPTLSATDTVPVTIAQMQLSYATMGGMSYVYQLADGKFIVVDGGVYDAVTQQYLANYLQTKATAAGMQKPVIAMWLFSHPHTDHIGLAEKSFLSYAASNGIQIESFAYNFTDPKNVPEDTQSSAIKVLKTRIKTHFPNATVYTMHAGQIYYFKGLTMEILATQEEFYPFLYSEVKTANIEQNHMCINWRVTFGNGKTAIFLADNSVPNSKQLGAVYKDYLKSDVMQTAHHGLSGAELACYQYIDPDICLWPSPYERFMGIYKGTLFGNKLAQDQWGLGFRYKLNSSGQPVDDKGNVVTDPAFVGGEDGSLRAQRLAARREHQEALRLSQLRDG